MPGILPREFYTRPAPEVAPALLGCRLVRVLDGVRLSGMITETEAYQGEEDLACHARSGRTHRTETMYGEGGHAYIYFTYGMHWLLNAVTCPAGKPAAVLIRALLPLEGEELMRANRPNQCGTASWLNGPAKLVQALALDGRQNGTDLCDPAGGLFIENGCPVELARVRVRVRVGIQSVPEPWRSMPWRWTLFSELF